MNAAHARLTWSAVALAVATGVLYGGLAYFGEVEDEFGPVAHPWTSTAQASHVVTVPLFVAALGRIWDQHIVNKLRSRATARRRTGIALLTQTIPMVATGYAIQVTVDADWRQYWVVFHLATSIAFTLLFVWHVVLRVTPARTSRTGDRA